MLDGLQRNVNYLLQDRERLVLHLRNIAEAIRVEGSEGLRGIFGSDQRAEPEQFFELIALAEAPLFRSAFHRDLPSDAAFSYDPPQGGPSETEHDDPLLGGSPEFQREDPPSSEDPPPLLEAQPGVPFLPFPEIDVSGDVFGLAAAGTVEQEQSAKVVASGDEPLLSFTP